MNEQPLLRGAAAYQADFASFRYDIETIGVVSIEDVTLTQGRLVATYSYRYGQEVRRVTSDLTRDHDGVYKGTCTTHVEGRVTFRVNTWLSFDEGGTAQGHWSWSGAPSSRDPKVVISRR